MAARIIERVLHIVILRHLAVRNHLAGRNVHSARWISVQIQVVLMLLLVEHRDYDVYSAA